MASVYGIVEMLLVFGVVLGLALREILVLRRERRSAGAPPDETG